MFIRPSLVKTQIKRNKKGNKVLMRTLGVFELQSLVEKTFKSFSEGKTIEKIFQENSIAKKHINDYKILILNKFLKSSFETEIDFKNKENLKTLSRFSKLSEIDPSIDLGFIYCIKINDKIKVGRTTNLIKRLSSYKSHSGKNPEILKVIFIVQHTKYEKDLLKKLSKSDNSFEWFEEKNKDYILENIK